MPVRVEAIGRGQGDSQPLHPHQLRHGVAGRRHHQGAGGLTSSGNDAGGRVRNHTALRASAMPIGPCRYSMAGYDSDQARQASRSLSATSLARPTENPEPRNVNWVRWSRPAGTSAATASSAWAMTGPRSSPRLARSRARVVVAKRVCTTDRSSAKSSTSAWSAAPTTAEAGSPVMASVGCPPHLPEQREDLGRVADRVIATTRS